MHDLQSEEESHELWGFPSVPKREIRRYHLDRMKKKAKKIWPWHKHAYKYANHLAYYGGFWNRNPRRTLKYLTIKEYSQLESERFEDITFRDFGKKHTKRHW